MADLGRLGGLAEPGELGEMGNLGGKGANLVRLRDAGFPVPRFVVLPVSEYRAFVEAHGLDAVIADAMTADAAAYDAREASVRIRAAFRRPLRPDQRERVVAAIGDLAGRPVAVRSSATAEDLPEASFAGQQDTFLQVDGLQGILDSVVECWSSLWTERAITYRARNGVGVEGLGLAVVVQEMVDAQASGVVFTADPLTGLRDRVVVDAVAGFGEQLVSGLVTPDHFEVEGATVVARTVQGEAPVLSDAQLLDLVAMSRRVADAFGAPQDIEFTRVGDDLALVQSRAITSLYPLPDGPRDAIYVSFGAVQGVLTPLTPLGRDVIRHLLGGVLHAFGPPERRPDQRTGHRSEQRPRQFGTSQAMTQPAMTQPAAFLVPAGERLWVRADRIVTGPARALALKALPIAEPVAAAIIASLVDEPAFAPRAGTRARLRLARGAAWPLARALPAVARNLTDPDAARARFIAVAEGHIDRLAAALDDVAATADPAARLTARVDVLRNALARAFGGLLRHFAPVMGPSLLMLLRLRALAVQTGLPDADALALTILRSLPDNVTTQMDLALFAASRRIAADPASVAALAADPAEVAAAYRGATLPPVAADALREFLDLYGMRGVAEIDVGSPRWRERPDQVIRTIQTYLHDADHAASYEEGRRAAAEAIERLAGALPPAKAAQVRFLGGRLRGLFGVRETPKFMLVRGLGLAREALSASGRDLVTAGRLDAADDVFFLSLDELRTAFTTDHRGVVAQRKALREREARRGRVPVVLVGDGRTFYSAPAGGTRSGAVAGTGRSDGEGAERRGPVGDRFARGGSGGDLIGTGVSPGVVTAAVRVVDDPATAELQPGEIMVCRGTDPAWTPLFLTAGGLITEVGGLMTHGSVVAREYGLPAVVGVAQATVLLTTGEVVTLDGSSGAVRRAT